MKNILLKLIDFFSKRVDKATTTGRIKLDCHYPDGSLKWSTGWMYNGTTNAGKAQIALLIGDASATPFTYLEVGTDATAFVASQTTLVAAITDTGLARAAATISRVTTTVTNDTYQATYTWSASGTKTIEEIGYFNAPSGGTMGGRAVTGSKVVNNLETLTGTYQVKIS